MNHNVWKDFIALFYPNICLICDKPIMQVEKFICVDCFLSMTRIQRETSGENDLLTKFAAFPNVILARSYMAYQRNGPSQQLIHAFKYNGHQMLAFFLGKLMAGEGRDIFRKNNWDYVVPVPLHKMREKSRGYNQAELLADGFAEISDIPVMNNQVIRVKKTMTQTGKDRISRWQSTKEMYEITENFQMGGKKVLLMDDVVTTGATISGLVEILVESGVSEIGIVSLASE